MPFITGGYPTLDVTRNLLPAIDSAGADIIEIGIPFSDPIADGPVIAGSMHEALLQGATPTALFDLVRSVRGSLGAGLVAMVSCSIIMRHGLDTFSSKAADAGFDGLIVPDLDSSGPNSPAGQLRAACDRHDLTLSLLIAPSTTEARIPELVACSSGFIYVLARAGITGERDDAPEIQDIVNRVRAHTMLPLAVGFGVSTAEHVRMVGRSADAAIVGSALVRRLGQADDPVDAAASFVRELATGCQRL